MSFKVLNLKNARKQFASPIPSIAAQPDRRSFLKTFGVGILAWNPVSDSFKSLGFSPFEINYSNRGFAVIREGKEAWQISDAFFEKGFTIDLQKHENRFLIKANNLRVHNMNLRFSMDAVIYKDGLEWRMDVRIPELGINQNVNFLEWLDNKQPLTSEHTFHHQLAELNVTDEITVDGRCMVNLNNEWNISLKGDNGIQVTLNGRQLATDEMIVRPFKPAAVSFLKSIPLRSVEILLPVFKGWEGHISNLNFYETNRIISKNESPSLHLLLGKSSSGSVYRAYWVDENHGNLEYQPDSKETEKFSFSSYFFFSEYRNGDLPDFYFAGKLPFNGQWFTNDIGAFKFGNDFSKPVFEAYGAGNRITSHVFEPLLLAFQPVVGNALSIPSYYSNPTKVNINRRTDTGFAFCTPAASAPQFELHYAPVVNTIPDTIPKRVLRGPVKNIQLPVKVNRPVQEVEKTPPVQERTSPKEQRTIQKVDKNTPQLDIKFDQVRFVPRKAVKITLLRPEDLILLHFEFHNFKFYNKNQAPFIELDNPKEKGTVVIYFPSQHTLEQAWFEAGKIPQDDNSSEESITLPANQLRARRSRLVYELEAGKEGFPLVMEELLDWSKYTLRVHPRAWIKLESIIRPGSFETIGKRMPARYESRSRYVLQTQAKQEFGIKLAQTNRIKVYNNDVYQFSNVEKVVSSAVSATFKPGFNIAAIRMINLKMEAVPETETSIEAPALMYISPNQVNDFSHKIELEMSNTEEIQNISEIGNTGVRKADEKVFDAKVRVFDPLQTTKGEIAELWHTKLGVKLTDGRITMSGLPKLRTIRVLWADDAYADWQGDSNKEAPPRNTPFMASLDANNRHKLVHQTSNYLIPNYYPTPVPVKKLMLTSLGAYLDWHVFFDVPTPADNYLNIIEWEHLATLGRDHYVKIVEEGYLYPFGHRAAVVKITERKFHKPTRAALNRQRMYVVVLEKEVLYSRNDPDGRFIEFPFQAVRIETIATPDIDEPVPIITVSSSGRGAKMIRIGTAKVTSYNFYINVGGQGFNFDITATDKEGFEHHLRMPLAFMENRIARDLSQMGQVNEKYKTNTAYNKISFQGQKVAYSECLVDGDTSFETESITFGGQQYPAKGEGDLKFHPYIQLADIFIKQVEEMTGVRKSARITLEDDNNDGQIFAKVSDAVVDFSGGSDKSGGFLTPNMNISGLSKLQGPIGGDIEDLKKLLFSAEKFFKALDGFKPPKIFGVIDIFSLLLDLGPDDLKGALDSFMDQVSKIRNAIEGMKNELLLLESQLKDGGESIANAITVKKNEIKNKVAELLGALNNQTPKIPNFKVYTTTEAFYAEYKWQPQLGGNTIEIFPDLLNVTVKNPDNALTVSSKFEKPFDTSKAAAMNGSARFEKFGIDIVPLLKVNFNYLEFKSGSSQKTDIKVEIDASDPIEFKGALSFVNSLQSLIPSTGFSEDGPFVNIKPTGITAGFNISIPDVTVGICMITNISLGAEVTLPFTGAPLTMAFNFCRRENPFLLTISCFGGGGFFRLVTTLHGMQEVEAAFEFGAAVSLNVGVASGGVSVMGGFYFKMEKKVIQIKGKDVDANEITLTGYLRINGHLSILGLITVSLEFYLAFSALMQTVNGKTKVVKLVGEATLKVKVEVLFFSKTVSVTVRRELAGADADPKFVDMIKEDDWQQYCLAFAG